MGEVIDLDTLTKADIPSEKLLQKAIEAGVTNVVIIGYDTSGKLWFASSDASCGDVIWLLEVAKKLMLDHEET